MSLKEKIHFIHANGFLPNAYSSFFNNLDTNLNLIHFNLNKPKYLKIKNWGIFRDDFIKNLKSNNKIIGIGHSIGGNIVLRSALSNPEYFSKIILLDPTLFIPKIILLWKFALFFKIHDFLHPWVKATLKRKMYFKNHKAIYESYRNKKVFNMISDDNLYIYINSITKKNSDDSIEIIYPKELEYQMYKTGLIADFYIWRNIKNINIPTLIICSKLSNAFLQSSSKKIKQIKNNNIKIIELENCTHLFPLEIPHKTAQIVNNFINNN